MTGLAAMGARMRLDVGKARLAGMEEAVAAGDGRHNCKDLEIASPLPLGDHCPICN